MDKSQIYTPFTLIAGFRKLVTEASERKIEAFNSDDLTTYLEDYIPKYEDLICKLESILVVNGEDSLAFDGPNTVTVRLVATDPVTCSELIARQPGSDRERFANAALNIGVRCIREAAGHVDVQSLREIGATIVKDLEHLFVTRGNDVMNNMSTTLQEHSTKFHELAGKDGEFKRVVDSCIASADASMAATLSTILEPLMRALSTSDQEGFLGHVSTMIKAMNQEQNAVILRELSLDYKDSAICRFFDDVAAGQERFSLNMQSKMDKNAREISLDFPDSALSRLVTRIDSAVRAVSEQFSLDLPNSALSRLSNEFKTVIAEIGSKAAESERKSEQFRAEVLELLATLKTERKTLARTPRPGLSFQGELAKVVESIANSREDHFNDVTSKPGLNGRTKVGDFVVQLGQTTSAPGAKFVFEAKAEEGYTLEHAFKELEEAKRNREAEVGVLVLSTKTAPTNALPFVRQGNSIVILWDADDNQTDFIVQVAYSFAVSLLSLKVKYDRTAHQTMHDIEFAAQVITQQIASLDEIRKLVESIKDQGVKLGTKADTVKQRLMELIGRLNDRSGIDDEGE